jgi:hypothetical protein
MAICHRTRRQRWPGLTQRANWRLGQRASRLVDWRTWRLALAVLGLAAVSAAAPEQGEPPARAPVFHTAHAATGTLFDPSPLTGRCGDPAGIWLGTRWRGEANWRLNSESIPGYLEDRDLVSWQIVTSATTVATGRNDCGLPQRLAIHQRYEGTTARKANVTRDGGCGKRDGHNVVSFGRLAPGLLAVTCVWWEGKTSNARSVESDILVDVAEGVFFLSLPEGCHDQWDLGSILTHEFGHVFGLGHVPYNRHGTLTMSDALPDCTTAYRRLGLGDYLALLGQYELPIRR